MKTIKLNNNQSLIIKALVNTDNYYAEPGFSDVSPQDIYKMVQSQMSKEAAKRALSSLYNKGILFTDTFENFQSSKTTIVYLSECIWHMIDWDVESYGFGNVEKVELEFTTEPENIKDYKPTGPRGPLAELTGKEFNVNDEAQKELAYFEALQKTDAKNAKTAMAKFIKSNRYQARYYGVILIKK